MHWCTDVLIDSSFAIPVLSHPLSSNGCLLPNASIGIWVDLGTRHWHVNWKCIVEHLSTWFDPGLPMLAPHSCLVTGVLPCQKYVNHYQSIRLKKRPQCSLGDGKLYHVVVAQQVPSHHLCFKSKQNQAWRSSGSSRKCFASKRNPTAIHLSHLNIKSFISLLNSGMFTMACTSTIERRLHHTFTLPKSCAHSRQSKPTESQPYLRKANYVRWGGCWSCSWSCAFTATSFLGLGFWACRMSLSWWWDSCAHRIGDIDQIEHWEQCPKDLHSLHIQLIRQNQSYVSILRFQTPDMAMPKYWLWNHLWNHVKPMSQFAHQTLKNCASNIWKGLKRRRVFSVTGACLHVCLCGCVHQEWSWW